VHFTRLSRKDKSAGFVVYTFVKIPYNNNDIFIEATKEDKHDEGSHHEVQNATQPVDKHSYGVCHHRSVG
jgi:hypothetical protein